MADFTQIIQEINDDINTNGVGAITGAKLNEVLRDMIAAVNQAKADMEADGSIFGGWIISQDTPPTYDGDKRYFYYAQQAGTYVYFDNVVLDGDHLAMLYWDENLNQWNYINITLSGNGLANVLSNYIQEESLFIKLGFQSFETFYNYDEGEVVSYEGNLYQFTANHPAGPWTGDDVDIVTMNGMIVNAISLLSLDKADKVSGATNGNLAGLDSDGNLADSGIAASDVVTSSDLAGKQDTLISGTNIKTVNGQSVLGSGNISISSGSPYKYAMYDADADADLTDIGSTTTNDISGTEPSQDTLSVVVLMPNAATNPTKTKMIATQEVGSSYVFIYVGDLQDTVPYYIFSAEAKQSLVRLLSKVAYIDEHGADYLSTLNTLLNSSVLSITVSYVQSGTVTDIDSLDVLRTDLTVTAYYSNGESAVVTDYDLSGTLAVGTSEITVTYGGKTATFNVAVTFWQPSFEIIKGAAVYSETDGMRSVGYGGQTTSNGQRAVTNPFSCKLPVGTYRISLGIYDGETTYYYGARLMSGSAVESVGDWGCSWGSSKTFASGNATQVNWEIPYSSWQNTRLDYIVTEEYQYIAINFKVGSAGTTEVTSTHLNNLNSQFTITRLQP